MNLRLSLFLLLISLSLTCSRSSNDREIRNLLNQMKAQAEALDTNALCSHISRHYQDRSENNYFIVCNLLKRYLTGLDSLEAELNILEISVSEKQAKAELELVVRANRGNNTYYILGSDRVPEYPVVWFNKERGKWKIVRVEGISSGSEESWW